MQKTLRLDGIGREYISHQTDLLYFPFHECLITRKEHISSAASVGEALPELSEENMTNTHLQTLTKLIDESFELSGVQLSIEARCYQSVPYS